MISVCSCVSEALLLALLIVSNNSSSDSKAFLRFIAFSGSTTAVHRPYGITLWAYLSEPLVKDSHKCLKFDGKTTTPRAQVANTVTYALRRSIRKHGTLVTFELSSFREKRPFSFTAFPAL